MELNTRIDVLREILERSGVCYGSGDTSSFFTNESEAVRVAQLICGTCPVQARAACLEYALSTNMEYGVWGGILFWDGRAFYRKRPPGRPRADEAALPVEASKEDLWALVEELSPMKKTA
ncbi:MAG: WhiB family transcriptional regulator [Acidimicrobiia bacterium]|nr:WhiB family transcriptional regulator [bacterium]MXX01317.1 WhiB family transcriptional regulator [Acidimicrobiia bacterium]MDE0673911.1 WhiB family transcriptional regulator [bacterium]MXX45145.1 WhiB family transcriptional regulator [Acidimicrobiia bacterium]MXY74022.1 WhiB family transcriptional regulator [Acidimicrobiia bacterium]